MRSQIYFPILRAKAGEYGAMAALSEHTKPLVCPIVDLPKAQSAQGFELLQAGVVQSLAKTWGTVNPLFLDLSRYDPDEKTAQGIGYAARLFESARQIGLKAAPVVGTVQDRFGTRGDYFRTVSQIMARDGHGVAIRLPHDDLSEPESLNSAVDEIKRLLDAEDDNCDVILDFGPIDKIPVSHSKIAGLMTQLLAPALGAFAKRRFRSIIFSASSIPRSLGKSADGIPVRVANSEYQVWSQLVGSVLGRQVRFGDYAARYAHQSDKASKASPPSRINIVTPETHVLCVGDNTSYRELADRVAGEPEFKNQFGAWGRNSVRDAASGRDGVGNAAEWVARDTQMHIETMTAAVKKRLSEVGEEFSAAGRDAYLYEQADLGF